MRRRARPSSEADPHTFQTRLIPRWIHKLLVFLVATRTNPIDPAYCPEFLVTLQARPSNRSEGLSVLLSTMGIAKTCFIVASQRSATDWAFHVSLPFRSGDALLLIILITYEKSEFNPVLPEIGPYEAVSLRSGIDLIMSIAIRMPEMAENHE